MLPAGPKIGFAGGYECNDTKAIWDAHDKVNAAWWITEEGQAALNSIRKPTRTAGHHAAGETCLRSLENCRLRLNVRLAFPQLRKVGAQQRGAFRPEAGP